jgi:hypothetical protein
MTATIFIVTPSLNSHETIDRTILSVATQAGDFFLRYHVQDGGSTDGTLERLEQWQRRLSAREFPLQCLGIEFSFASQPDTGMYDAICAGFGALRIGDKDFMTWINADDILTQGACALIASIDRQLSAQQLSWIGGASAVLRGDMPLLVFDNPITRAALRAGLCDGVHWNFLQQEGVFFRKWLWSAIDPERNIRPMKLAGDWNLWRLFAERSSLVQTKLALGRFRIVEGQLSAQRRDSYMAEIDAIIPHETRRQSLADLGKAQPVLRRVLKIRYADAQLSVAEQDGSFMWKHNHEKVFGEPPRHIARAAEQQVVATGLVETPPEPDPIEDILRRTGNILAYDRDWQFPAITEQHAYRQMRDIGAVPDNITYVAYPWATLIDKLQTKARDAHLFLKRFREYCAQLPSGKRRVTVCQHIKMKEFMQLFNEAGISDIFWSHATREDLATCREDGITLHPFPLYPVQIDRESDACATADRPFLFSFIGARSNKYYLTNARELIIDLLSDHPRGLVIGRDSWHYNKVVYEHQIRNNGKLGGKDELVNQSASEQFKASLEQSLFSLCPSGSGPNSIRLWESLGAGSIPVILADTYAPPGNSALWDQAVVFCEESEAAIKALPERLEAIASDPARLAMMRHAMRQLWILYGPHGFVCDIQNLMLKLAGTRGAEIRSNPDEIIPFAARLSVPSNDNASISVDASKSLLQFYSGQLLLKGFDALEEIEARTDLSKILLLAQDRLGPDDRLVRHFRSVRDHVTRIARPRLVSPEIARNRPAKVCLYGRHSNRTPLSYEPFQRTTGSRLEFVDEPLSADIVMTGFNIDIRENPQVFEELVIKRPNAKVVVISEEPLWDSIWSGGFVERIRSERCGDVELTYTFLNHSNSSIFNFDAIPYFLLTNENYLSRYGILLARYASVTPSALLDHWNSAPVPAAFFAEVRERDAYAASHEQENLYGLSVYRTEVARKVDLPGTIRNGRGWQPEARRQDLPDWHLDKIAATDMRVRIMSAYENTHQRNYVTEKIFDAFVVGGIPTYYADPGHKALTLVPRECMINTFGMSSDEAAACIKSLKPDIELAKAWLNTASNLQKRFTDPDVIETARQRVVDAILSELTVLS